MSVSPNFESCVHDHALVTLCARVLPVWARQLASSRSQSETAVAEMLGAFAEIGPHLDMATRQSGQITSALAQGSGGITGLADACEQELGPLLPTLDAPSAATIGRVMQMIRSAVDALETISKPFERETQLVGQQVERMYRGFQYQDRISQMMTLLHQDIERLQNALTDASVDVDSTAWLSRLESQYVMTEQRHHHSEQGGAGAADDEETTFF
jgi:hypothetical protein